MFIAYIPASLATRLIKNPERREAIRTGAMPHHDLFDPSGPVLRVVHLNRRWGLAYENRRVPVSYLGLTKDALIRDEKRWAREQPIRLEGAFRRIGAMIQHLDSSRARLVPCC